MMPFDGQGLPRSKLEQIVGGTVARFLLAIFLVRVGPILDWLGWLIILLCCLSMAWQEYDFDKKHGII